MESRITKRSIVIAGRKTSLSLEDEFWRAFKEIASARETTLTELAGSIDSGRAGNLSSAIRLFVLAYYRSIVIALPDFQNAHAATQRMR